MTAPSTTTREPLTLTIVPANMASWADLQAIFGTADYPGMCYCQRFKTRDCHWSSLSDQERRSRLREQTHCGHPRAQTTTGLVAYLGKEITWGELHVGSRQVFADAGFTEVSHPSPRRVVMRIDLTD